MGGAVVWAEAKTKEQCERELREHIEEARRMGLEDVGAISPPVQLDNGNWYTSAWLHS